MKRLLSLLLVVMMVATIVGCGNNNGAQSSETQKTSSVASNEERKTSEAESASTEVAEPKTFTMFAANQSVDMKYDENPGFLWACDNTNVYFDITMCSTADLAEKRNLLLASGDYPEVFYKSSLQDGYEYGSQGIFIPLEDLIRENAPNLTALLDAQDGWKYITASDGHVYTLPEMQGFGIRDPYFFINTKWLSNLGLKMPTDIDSLYTALKAFKEKDANGNGDPNDEVPLAVSASSPSIYYLAQYFGYNYIKHREYFAIDENGEVFFMANNDEWKEFITFLKKLYDEELVNQDCFTITLDELKARASSNKDHIYGCFWDWASYDYIVDGWNPENTSRDDWSFLPPFTEGTLPTSSGYKQGTLAITDKCTDPAAVIAWADQFYSEEGALIGKNGVEGISLEWLEDGTWDAIYDAEGNSMINGYTKVQGYANHPGLYPTEFQLKNVSVALVTREAAEIVKVAADPWPTMQYTEEETNKLSVVKTDINGYVWEYLSNVVVGKMDLNSTWDNYVKTLNDMGLEDYNKIVQDAYARGMNK